VSTQGLDKNHKTCYCASSSSVVKADKKPAVYVRIAHKDYSVKEFTNVMHQGFRLLSSDLGVKRGRCIYFPEKTTFADMYKSILGQKNVSVIDFRIKGSKSTHDGEYHTEVEVYVVVITKKKNGTTSIYSKTSMGSSFSGSKNMSIVLAIIDAWIELKEGRGKNFDTSTLLD